MLSFVSFAALSPLPFSRVFWLKKSSSSCCNEFSLLLGVPLLACCCCCCCGFFGMSTTGSGSTGADEKLAKKSNDSGFDDEVLLLSPVGCCDAFALGTVDDVSSVMPSKSRVFDGDADDFFASARAFFGECGFGRGAGMAIFAADGDDVDLAGSGRAGTPPVVVVFFFRF